MSTTDPNRLADPSDLDLLSEVKTLAHREREAIARLIASLAELDARRLYLDEGCSSLFTYCTQVLCLSEHAAYGRIDAARAARRCPAILDLLAAGAVTLTTIGLIAPHLTAENHEALLAAIRGKSKREVENLVAAIRPQPAVPSSIRKLPQPALKPASDATPPPPMLVGGSDHAGQDTPAPMSRESGVADVRGRDPRVPARTNRTRRRKHAGDGAGVAVDDCLAREVHALTTNRRHHVVPAMNRILARTAFHAGALGCNPSKGPLSAIIVTLTASPAFVVAAA